jgi:hypothetical protein
MARIGFFQALLDDDMSWGERDAINSAHDRADAAAMASADAAYAVSLLQRRLTEQRKELDKVRTAPKLLDYRLEAAMDELEEADGTGETKPAPQLTTCSRCEVHIPVTNTVVTDAGTVCDSCFARG